MRRITRAFNFNWPPLQRSMLVYNKCIQYMHTRHHVVNALVCRSSKRRPACSGLIWKLLSMQKFYINGLEYIFSLLDLKYSWQLAEIHRRQVVNIYRTGIPGTKNRINLRAMVSLRRAVRRSRMSIFLHLHLGVRGQRLGV